MTSLQHFDKYYFALKHLKTREFWQNTNVFGFKTACYALLGQQGTS